MTTQAAFLGSYADWKLIKTRGVIQIVVEVPLHDHDRAYQALGGMPDPQAEVWLGITRVKVPEGDAPVPSTLAATLSPSASERGRGLPSPDKPIKPVSADKKLSQRAGIICNEPAFWKFATEKDYPLNNADEAAEFVREWCQVESRKDIRLNTPAGELFMDLEGQYRLWRDHPELVG